MKNQIASRDDFEQWLFAMDDALESFLSSFPIQDRKLMDYSPDSLCTLENWLLQKYSSTTAMLEANEAKTVDGVARYVGETFRRKLGGIWDIGLSDPKYVYFGLPVLRGEGKKTTPICPHTLATASVDRRSGTFMKTVLNNSAKFENA